MAWHVEGTYFENCNCDFACPCSLSFFEQPADNERCIVAVLFNVESGEIEGTDVGGLTIGLVADAPGKMADGNWRAGVLMDAAATPEQAEKLGALFGGQLGGPMEALAPMIGENLGVEVVPIEFTAAARSVRAQAGDLVEVDLEALVLGDDPDGDPVRISGMQWPNSTLTGARAKTSKIKAFGIEVSNGGTKNAFYSPFAWSG